MRLLHKNNSKGFTLIELLVVIAIIGLLAAVVLASLSSARSKASDSAIQSQLKSAMTQAELFRISTNSYSGICSATRASDILNNLMSESGATGVVKNGSQLQTKRVACEDSQSPQSLLIISVPTATYDTVHAYWCIDSTGIIKLEPGSTVLDASVTTC